MGMFDTFHDVEADITCTKCNNKHIVEDGIQSKKFENLFI